MPRHIMLPETLIDSISKDDIESVQSFLKKNPLVLNYQCEDYQILRDVLCYHQVQMVEILITEGFRVNLKPQHCPISTPLHLAVNLGSKTIVELLLAKGAEVDVCDEIDQSPLHVAAKMNKYALVDLLLPLVSKGYQRDKDGLSHMHIACLRGNTRLVQKFLRNSYQLSQYEKLNLSVSENSLLWPGFTPLHFAVYSQNIETIQILLDSGADLAIQDANESTPLHLAHSLQNNQIVDLILLSHKYVSGNPRNKATCSHFHIACTRDNPVIVASFLQQDLHPYEVGDAVSPLLLAVKHKCTDVIQYILDYNRLNRYYRYDKIVEVAVNNMSQREIKKIFGRYGDEACRNDSMKLLKPLSDFQRCCTYPPQLFLDLSSLDNMVRAQRADVNEIVSADSAFWPSGTPLHFAATSGCPDVVEFLVQNGANINAMDARNKTPLHCAFENDRADALDRIIYYCSDVSVNPANNNGLTHFHIFCAKNRATLVKRFLRSDMDVNHQVQNDSILWPGFSSLHFAVYFNSKETVETLLRHGCDVDKKNGSGLTALEMSVMNLDTPTAISEMKETMSIIQLLLQFQHSTIASSSNKGFSLLQLACSSDNDDPSELQKILLLDGNINKSIDIDVPRYGGYTALHFAVESSLTNKIKWLLDNGANPGIKDASGNTPLHLWRPSPDPDHKCNIDLRLILQQNPISRQTGKSHFHVLCEFADFDTFEYALNAFRFDVNQKIEMNFTFSQASMTGLHLAINGSDACSQKIQLLVDRGADVNARDFKGNTPLHYTGANELTEDLKILLANNADINAINIFGKTPMHELCQSDLRDGRNEEYTWIYNFLVNESNSKFMTNKLKIMLANGANIDVVDGSGHTPLTLRISRVSRYSSDVVSEHLIKLMELGFPINEKNNSHFLDERRSFGRIHPCEEKFLSLCRGEIEKMEKTEIVKPYNLRNLLSKDIDVMARHVANIRLQSLVESDNFPNEFPLYGYLVRLQFRRGKVRRNKLEQTVCYMNLIAALQLPRELSLKILQYLTNNELDNLALASTGMFAHRS